QLVLAATQLALDPLPLDALHEQAGDEGRLRQHHDDGADDVALVLIPDARFPEHDAGTGWETRLVYPQAAQLPPVHRIDIRVGRGHRYVVGSLSAKHAKRDRGDGLHLGHLVAAPAADDARVDGDIRPAVRRRVGRGRDAGEVGHLLDELARAVLAHDDVV